MSKDNQNGFTLLELLIAMTVIISIVVITSGSFRLAYQSIGKGEKKIQNQRRKNIAVSLISEHLDALWLDKNCVFTGKKNRIRFNCYTETDDPESYRLIEVEYSVEPSDQEGLFDLKMEQETAFSLAKELVTGDNKTTLLSGINDFSIHYLVKNSQKGIIFVEEWTDLMSFPLGVKISFGYKGKPVSIFSRILNTNKINPNE